jgi:hypothetical protein
MSGIFISYRRDDSSGSTGRIADRLVERFGDAAVFRDVSDIAPGENFVDAVGRSIGASAVVLVIIGRHWLNIRNSDGLRRLDNPADLVRREVEMALGGKGVVIPLLVDGARMPAESDLPESIRKLAFCNALTLNDETFDYGIRQLIRRIEQVVRPGRRLWPVAAAVLLALAAAGYFYFTRADTQVIESARTVSRTGDFAAAWKILEGHGGSAVQVAREDLAMQWARDIRVSEGGSFSAITAQLTPVLASGAAAANGARKADLLAHLGWATFLQSRETATGNPEPFYRQALEADTANPYAHAMLGHWRIWKQHERGLAEARRHFSGALAAERDRAAVRRLQFAALMNLQTDEAQAEFARALNDARKHRDTLDERTWGRGYSVYYLGFRPGELQNLLRAAMPSAEHVETLRMLISQREDAAQKRLLECWVGRIEESAGRRDAALAAYRRAEAGLDRHAAGPVPDEIRAALVRLVNSAGR